MDGELVIGATDELVDGIPLAIEVGAGAGVEVAAAVGLLAAPSAAFRYDWYCAGRAKNQAGVWPAASSCDRQLTGARWWTRGTHRRKSCLEAGGVADSCNDDSLQKSRLKDREDRSIVDVGRKIELALFLHSGGARSGCESSNRGDSRLPETAHVKYCLTNAGLIFTVDEDESDKGGEADRRATPSR